MSKRNWSTVLAGPKRISDQSDKAVTSGAGATLTEPKTSGGIISPRQRPSRGCADPRYRAEPMVVAKEEVMDNLEAHTDEQTGAENESSADLLTSVVQKSLDKSSELEDAATEMDLANKDDSCSGLNSSSVNESQRREHKGRQINMINEWDLPEMQDVAYNVNKNELENVIDIGTTITKEPSTTKVPFSEESQKRKRISPESQPCDESNSPRKKICSKEEKDAIPEDGQTLKQNISFIRLEIKSNSTINQIDELNTLKTSQVSPTKSSRGRPPRKSQTANEETSSKLQLPKESSPLIQNKHNIREANRAAEEIHKQSLNSIESTSLEQHLDQEAESLLKAKTIEDLENSGSKSSRGPTKLPRGRPSRQSRNEPLIQEEEPMVKQKTKDNVTGLTGLLIKEQDVFKTTNIEDTTCPELFKESDNEEKKDSAEQSSKALDVTPTKSRRGRKPTAHQPTENAAIETDLKEDEHTPMVQLEPKTVTTKLHPPNLETVPTHEKTLEAKQDSVISLKALQSKTGGRHRPSRNGRTMQEEQPTSKVQGSKRLASLQTEPILSLLSEKMTQIESLEAHYAKSPGQMKRSYVSLSKSLPCEIPPEILLSTDAVDKTSVDQLSQPEASVLALKQTKKTLEKCGPGSIRETISKTASKQNMKQPSSGLISPRQRPSRTCSDPRYKENPETSSISPHLARFKDGQSNILILNKTLIAKARKSRIRKPTLKRATRTIMKIQREFSRLNARKELREKLTFVVSINLSQKEVTYVEIMKRKPQKPDDFAGKMQVVNTGARRSAREKNVNANAGNVKKKSTPVKASLKTRKVAKSNNTRKSKRNTRESEGEMDLFYQICPLKPVFQPKGVARMSCSRRGKRRRVKPQCCTTLQKLARYSAILCTGPSGTLLHLSCSTAQYGILSQILEQDSVCRYYITP